MSLLRSILEECLDPQQVQALPDHLKQRLETVGRLLEVTRALAGEIDPAEILESIVRDACSALSCERASLYQYDAKRDELHTTIVTELEIAEIRRGLDQGICGFAARERRMVNVDDPVNDPRWNPAVDAATGFVTRNILAAPLIAPHDGSLLGVLQLLNRKDQAFDEIDEALFEAFSQHAAVALERSKLVGALRNQQAVRASLDVARAIQRGFMPDELPRLPGYEMATWWFPNEAVGGDYCDVVRLNDGRLGLVIADVSGHGLGPSLIMASLRAALHAMVLEHAAPEVLLNLLGRSLRGDLKEGRFITMVLAALDPRDNCLQYANAGHAPALHYQASTDEFNDLESTGMPLGVLERPEYPQGWPIDLEVGDLIVLCTDGIVEAMDQENKQFGNQQLKDLLRSMSKEPVRELVENVGKQVESHYVGNSPPDDLTILAVRRNR